MHGETSPLREPSKTGKMKDLRKDVMKERYIKIHTGYFHTDRPKIKYLFSRATFHIPLTKYSENRLLHCSLWQFSGALFCISGAKSPGTPV